MTLLVRSVNLWTLISVLAIPCLLAQDQDENGLTTDIIPLQHVSLSEMVDLVQSVNVSEYETLTGSEANNSLIVRGTPEQVDKIRHFVQRIDVPTDRQNESKTEFIPVRTYPIQDLLPLVEQVIGNSLDHSIGSVALDSFNNRLVITAPEKELKIAREFVAQLDQPRQLLTIHISFLRGEIGVGTGKSETNLPETFKAVVETLRENGLSNATLMAPFTIKTQAGDKFGSISTLEAWSQGNKGLESLQFQVKGAVRTLSDSGQIELEIESNMKGKIETSDDKLLTPYFELETTLVVPIGKYVVLALAPSSTLSGNAVALVLRVTKD